MHVRTVRALFVETVVRMRIATVWAIGRNDDRAFDARSSCRLQQVLGPFEIDLVKLPHRLWMNNTGGMDQHTARGTPQKILAIARLSNIATHDFHRWQNFYGRLGILIGKEKRSNGRRPGKGRQLRQEI